MLRVAHSILGVLNILNWVLGVLAILAFAILSIVRPPLVFSKLAEQFTPAQLDALTVWLLVSAAVTLVVMPLAHLIFTRLRAMIADTQGGEPFAPQSVQRLRTIAWSLLGISAADLVFGLVSVEVSEATGEYLGWSPSLTPWLAAGMLFILARIFAEGVAMRADLEGTV